jgi:hypothetical protein
MESNHGRFNAVHNLHIFCQEWKPSIIVTILRIALLSFNVLLIHFRTVQLFSKGIFNSFLSLFYLQSVILFQSKSLHCID